MYKKALGTAKLAEMTQFCGLTSVQSLLRSEQRPAFLDAAPAPDITLRHLLAPGYWLTSTRLASDLTDMEEEFLTKKVGEKQGSETPGPADWGRERQGVGA